MFPPGSGNSCVLVNCFWKHPLSTSRTLPGGKADRKQLPTGENGRILCRYCSLEVPPGRFTFCSDWCVEEWRLRSNPSYLREKVLERDRGVCAVCKIDCTAAWFHLKRARGAARARAWSAWGIRPGQRKSLWDADHILPVVEGGGECDLSNLRTLCLNCHRAATAALRQRLVGQAGSLGRVGNPPPPSKS